MASIVRAKTPSLGSTGAIGYPEAGPAASKKRVLSLAYDLGVDRLNPPSRFLCEMEELVFLRKKWVVAIVERGTDAKLQSTLDRIEHVLIDSWCQRTARIKIVRIRDKKTGEPHCTEVPTVAECKHKVTVVWESRWRTQIHLLDEEIYSLIKALYERRGCRPNEKPPWIDFATIPKCIGTDPKTGRPKYEGLGGWGAHDEVESLKRENHLESHFLPCCSRMWSKGKPVSDRNGSPMYDTTQFATGAELKSRRIAVPILAKVLKKIEPSKV